MSDIVVTVPLTAEERESLLECISDALESYTGESTSYDAALRRVRNKLKTVAELSREARPDTDGKTEK